MKVIGITGSSGSGKTTIGEILNQRKDTKIMNADQMAKALNKPGTEYFSEIQKAFENENIVLENGTLNRAKLANLIYHDNHCLETLNRITFRHLIPQIETEIHSVMPEIKILVIDAPLLFEAGLDKLCDITIAIEAPIELKIKRICKRDKIPEEVAKARLEIQKSNQFYRENADYVIENDESISLEELEEKVNKLFFSFT